MLLRRRLKLCFTLILTLLIASFLLWQNVGPVEPLVYETVVYQTNVSYTYPMGKLAANDYNSLIDLDDFKFLILDELCGNSDVLLLVLVHSAPQNFAKRMTIRKTWGQYRDGMRTVFMLGCAANNARIQTQLLEENMIYRDFAQGNFLDTYKNITYKHVMVFKYAIYHCPQAKYVLKVDDDVFVNVYTMMTVLKETFSPNGCSNLLLCKVLRTTPVLRDYGSKWRVSIRDYPMEMYVPYCPGFAVLYSKDVVFALYKEAQLGDYFWIDDVHVTGTLAHRANIVHTDARPFMLEFGFRLKELRKRGPDGLQFLYARSDLREWQIVQLWNFVHRYTSRRFFKPK